MKLLIVDDERHVLRGLSRMIDCWEQDWIVETAEDGEEALRRLSAEHFDVVLTDVRMPGMNGAELLTRVAAEHPHMIRIALSGQPSGHGGKDMVIDVAKPMHRFLAKPCPADELRSTLTKACLLQSVLEHPRLHSFVTRISSLPSTQSLYNELLDEIESPRGTVGRVAEIISRDPGMTAKVLQLANSAAVGVRAPVTSPRQAVSLLGMHAVRKLVFSHEFRHAAQAVTESGQKKSSDDRDFNVDALMDHSLKVGLMARAIAHAESDDDGAYNEAFTAGLLHDIGKMVLMEAASEEFERARQLAEQRGIPLWEAEREVFGASHDTLGAHLLALWGLPQPIVDAVAAHHGEIAGEGFSPAAAVAVANLALHAEDVPARDSRLRGQLQKQGLYDRFESWRRAGLLNLSKA
ncbi:MAG: HDOD domain-containing protein [Planctomycetales bacterium]|nr:HDOD domain-containing protein [Planctomycetales bacterium]